MIQANELRIGNWVNWFGEPRQILSVGNNIDDEVYNPIPLTPEVWERIGEKQVRNFTPEFKATFAIQGYVFPLMKYPYVHQLQNLYFALTGEELKIDL